MSTHTTTTTRQWACISMLTLLVLASTLTSAHVVKPPPKPTRSRKLQQHEKPDQPQPQPTSFRAQMDHTGANPPSDGIYGGGHGSGGTSFGFHNILPFPAFPFGVVVPEVSTWGQGGGFGGSNANPGTGTNCQCACGCPMNYVISPVVFRPVDTTSRDIMTSSPFDVRRP